MPSHGGIGVDGLSLDIISSPEGIELRGKTIEGGSIVITPSSAHFLETTIAEARHSHNRLVTHIEDPTEEAFVVAEQEARKKLDAAEAANREASSNWRAAHDAVAHARLKRLPKDHELTYSYAKCDCGAHLAYWSGANPSAWDCSDILLGNVGTPEDKALVADASYEAFGG